MESLIGSPLWAVESHMSIWEPEDMNVSERGLKHVCTVCATKYYDLRKKTIACPICGTEPPAPKVPKAALPARKTGRLTFGRYPKKDSGVTNL